MENPLLTTKPPDTTLSVQLHPLVLLTITDYITRHIARSQTHPIVGAVIGQQNGRTVTLEHAYEAKTALQDDGEIALDG
jgi:COP9 signalosome complex subunit 6